MYKITSITDVPLQKMNIVLPEGNGELSLTMYYVSLQYGWFFTNLTYIDFTVNNFRVCNSLNMLHQFKNILPFGLACYTKGNREPTQIKDFSSGASVLYVLTAEEVAAVNGVITGGG